MQVRIKVFGTLQKYLHSSDGRHHFIMELKSGTTAGDVLSELKIPEQTIKMIFVNGKFSNENIVLKAGDVLSLFPPVGGG